MPYAYAWAKTWPRWVAKEERILDGKPLVYSTFREWRWISWPAGAGKINMDSG